MNPNPLNSPCPFCGGSPKLESDSHRREFGRDRFRIVCSSCYAGTRWYNGPDEAWLMWNGRSQQGSKMIRCNRCKNYHAHEGEYECAKGEEIMKDCMENGYRYMEQKDRCGISYPSNIKRIGNTFHVIVPKAYVQKCGWEDGQDVDVSITEPEVKG